MSKHHNVYFLQNGKKSYIGYTTDLHRRIRQHRGEITGGAKYTTSWPNRDVTKVIMYISGFPTHKLALSYEWHAKRRPKKSKNPSANLFSAAHSRFAQFLAPLFLEKFQNIIHELQIYLVEHHDYRDIVQEHYQIDCVNTS
jgi:putative endonuclease